ncbi:pentatricopeptide repeat-containing protein At3g22670, mitochondrial [Arachis stenosperma]|uniref:pentatricopeptide repeat-containing protein At3g22670, mitochondrial n=1 Tax=Arachis stenosperma TaxID=217475 RepID=UPI0025AC634F|nr:pentatricopeptide repeat-containing protein At3g22670, mitochondrial [Arachis stenosperma]XP_057756890.1 pentatricopeptide repeat-containing protein At3g22670, mitochondrial [Arachis stenosperma]XP_057756891.1 pentatricopeptide repeat-containing protein At3g22670, mitochondrial [Arachis stenosperma]
MLSKLRFLNHFVRKNLSTRTTAFSGFYRFSNSGAFCTVADSTTQPTPESYELPDWVKFSDNPTSPNGDYDEDFVIPSLAPWVDGHLLHPTPKFVITPTSQPNNLEEVEAITTLLKEKHPSPEKVAQALAQLSGFKVSKGLVEQILKRFSNDWVSAFGFFSWAKVQTGYEHSPQLYNFMVDILAKSKNFDLMWELVEEMAHLQQGYVTSDTLVKVMRRLAKAGKHEYAIEVFRRMGKFGVKQDTAMLNALMDALVKGNSVEHAHDALLEFKGSVPLNSHSFNVLIHGWCKVRKFEWAKKAMEDMKEHGFHPDAFSYTTFVESYCREKDFRKVDRVMEEMRKNGCTPNAVTYTIVMLALGKAGQLKEALELYEKMKVDGGVPDTAFYSSLIFILGKAGRIKDARDVFEDMPKQGVVRDVMTYNTMISIACTHQREETALRLLKEMEDSTYKPDLETYHPLLKMCCRKKRMKVLRFLLDHMLRNDLSPEVGTYTLLVHGMCRSGKLESACSFFEEMVLQGLTPKEVTRKLLLGELESKNMIKEKQHIEDLMARVQRNNLVTS